MPGRDIIVIGASAGGVEAVSAVARGLPPDLPAAVFVVVHFPPWSRSVLPQILERAGTLPAAHAVDGEIIRRGRIYVAPPGRHLLIHQGVVRLVVGPRENGAIPAVDPLFRSAARWFGDRVIGVVLSGNLDDGSAGLVAIKHRGGLAVAQDPAEALYDGMPRNAVETVPMDHVVPMAQVGPLLASLVGHAPGPPAGGAPGDIVNHTPTESMDERIERESDIMEMQPSELGDDDRPGELSGFTCPECHGALWEIQEGEVVRYRCRVGHGYTAEALVAEQGRDVEAALWIAFRALRERAALCRRMAQRMASRGQQALATRQLAEAADVEQRAAVLRQVLLRAPETEQMASD